jgi:signal recognition particle subunit SRP54
VEKAAQHIQQEDAEKMAAKMLEGRFDLEDMLSQFQQIKKMGDIKGLLGMMPGIAKMKKQIDEAKIDDKAIGRQEAIILSMTKKERQNPDLIKASRKKRIAAGSGVEVSEVNKLLKQHQQMAMMMKKMKKMGGKKGLLGGLGKLFGGGMPSPEELGAGGMPDLSMLQKGGGLPPGMPSLGGGPTGTPGGLSPDLLRALGKRGGKKR